MSTLPLSVEAYDQFQQLIFILDDTHLLQGKDQWSYIWGSTEFASNKSYLHLMHQANITGLYMALKFLLPAKVESFLLDSFKR